MNIGITGASGFIGGYLAKSLIDGNTIITLSHHDAFSEKKLKTFVMNSEIIFHLAGVNKGSDSDIVSGNSLLTQKLCDAITKYNTAAKLIFASSFQVYGNDTMYSIAKKFSEEIIRYYSIKYNLKSTILRLSNVYGPGCKPFYNSIIATLLDCLKNDKQVNINGNGDQKIDFINIEDVVLAFKNCLSLKGQKNSKTVDICTGRRVTLNFVIELFNKYSKKKIDVCYVLDRQVKSHEITKDYLKAKKYLNWMPQVTLEEGIKNLLRLEYESKK